MREERGAPAAPTTATPPSNYPNETLHNTHTYTHTHKYTHILTVSKLVNFHLDGQLGRDPEGRPDLVVPAAKKQHARAKLLVFLSPKRGFLRRERIQRARERERSNLSLSLSQRGASPSIMREERGCASERVRIFQAV